MSGQARITAITVTYSGSTGTDPTITFNNGSYTIGGSALDLSTLFTSNSNGAVTYTVKTANGTGASISGTSFTATTAGTCTVQAAQAAQGSYNAKTVTATITVSTAPINVTLHYKGTTAVLSNQTNPYTLPTTGTYVADACDAWVFDGWYGNTYAKSTSKPTYITQLTSSGDAYAVYKNVAGGSGSSSTFVSSAQGYSNASPASEKVIDGVTYTWGDGALYYTSGSSVRMYANNTLTITASSAITAIDFTYSQGALVQAGASTGTITTGDWSGSASSITFTNTTGSQVRISQIIVTIGGGGTTYYSTDAECGPKVQATASPWVTSTNGQFVKVEVPVTATNFDKSSTLSASVSGAGFSIVGWGANGNSVTKDVDLTTSLILAYNPSAYNTTADATITFSSNYSGSQTPVYAAGTVHGRSLPEKFVIAIKNGDQWYALPANMSGSNTYAGIAVNVDNTTNPTKVTAGPATALYSLLNVYKTGGSGDRYANYGTRVRFLGNEKCLWSNAANSGTGISNNAVPNSATSDNYEWTLVTTDGVNYAINTNVAKKIEEGRELRYYAGESRFGMYTSGNSSFRFLPVDCD
ncbi:MAG: hypothetical protein II452_01550, partial [Paludibacteraceae bacterium]|nr:hypothetical protein [Paludibacteraceae bacterium]